MKIHATTLVIVAAITHSLSVHAADMSALLTSAEATAQEDSIPSSQSAPSEEVTSGGTGVSKTSEVRTEVKKTGEIAVSDFSMLMGPSFNEFISNAPSSAQPYSGFSARHVLRMDYMAARDIAIGPSLDLSEYMYTSRQGTFVFNDPSMRVEFNNLNRTRFGDKEYSGSVWLAVYAPVSTRSQGMHEYTAVSAAYIPKLQFHGSRFTLNGVGSVKVNVMKNQAQTGMIAPIQFVTAIQGNYKVSRVTTVFMMDHVNTNCGPQMALLSTDFGADNFRRRVTAGNAVNNGIMTGAQFRVFSGVSVSPRMDWTTSQPIGTTTVGLNAMFSLI